MSRVRPRLNYFEPFRFHLARAARFAIALRFFALSAFALAGPPLRPPRWPRATAAGFLPPRPLAISGGAPSLIAITCCMTRNAATSGSAVLRLLDRSGMPHTTMPDDSPFSRGPWEKEENLRTAQLVSLMLGATPVPGHTLWGWRLLVGWFPSRWMLSMMLLFGRWHLESLIARAKPEERAALIAELELVFSMLVETHEEEQAEKLLALTRKRKYASIIIPPLPTGREDHNWAVGRLSGRQYLRRTAASEIWRQIYEIRQRRRGAVQSWARVAASALPWLTVLVIALGLLRLSDRIARLLPN